MVLRKWASDALCAADEDAYFAASAARSFAARSVREVSFAGEGAARSVLGGSASTAVYHEEEGSTTKPIASSGDGSEEQARLASEAPRRL